MADNEISTLDAILSAAKRNFPKRVFNPPLCAKL